jgi:hypothetical protein
VSSFQAASTVDEQGVTEEVHLLAFLPYGVSPLAYGVSPLVEELGLSGAVVELGVVA